MAEVVSFKKEGVETGSGPVIVARDGGVLRLTLNNPPANALSIALMEALLAELARAADDAEVRVRHRRRCAWRDPPRGCAW